MFFKHSKFYEHQNMSEYVFNNKYNNKKEEDDCECGCKYQNYYCDENYQTKIKHYHSHCDPCNACRPCDPHKPCKPLCNANNPCYTHRNGCDPDSHHLTYKYKHKH
jgi:hypothetical protein